MNDLRKAAQPEQEPVAWSPALTYPDYEQQRVWANGKPRPEDVEYWAKNGNGITCAYTAPPQRKPLTDDEINALFPAHLRGDYKDLIPYSFARAIEKAHGIGVKE